MIGTVIHASVRTFFVSLCAMLGLFFGLVIIALIFGLIETADRTPASHFSPEVVANAKGIRKILSKSAPVILKLNIVGDIGGERLSSHTINSLLIESRESTLKNDRVKAILLYVNTPGGTIMDADAIYRALLQYKQQYNTPIYAFVDGLCASGGMYVVSAADKIYATDTSLIGSVGVLLPPFFNASKVMEKFGVDALSLSAGKDKDLLSPVRPWTPDEQKPLQEILDHYYNVFVDIVTKARPKVSREKLVTELGANTFPAPQALSYGLIDVAGASYESALTDLLKKIGIDDDYYQVIQLDQSPWASLFKSQNSILTGKIRHTFDLPNGLSPELANQFLYLYRP